MGRFELFTNTFHFPDAKNRPSWTAWTRRHRTGQNGYAIDRFVGRMYDAPHQFSIAIRYEAFTFFECHSKG